MNLSRPYPDLYDFWTLLLTLPHLSITSFWYKRHKLAECREAICSLFHYLHILVLVVTCKLFCLSTLSLCNLLLCLSMLPLLSQIQSFYSNIPYSVRNPSLLMPLTIWSLTCSCNQHASTALLTLNFCPIIPIAFIISKTSYFPLEYLSTMDYGYLSIRYLLLDFFATL